MSKVPDYFDYEAWTGPAPLRPYDCPKYEGGDPLRHVHFPTRGFISLLMPVSCRPFVAETYAEQLLPG